MEAAYLTAVKPILEPVQGHKKNLQQVVQLTTGSLELLLWHMAACFVLIQYLCLAQNICRHGAVISPCSQPKAELSMDVLRDPHRTHRRGAADLPPGRTALSWRRDRGTASAVPREQGLLANASRGPSTGPLLSLMQVTVMEERSVPRFGLEDDSKHLDLKPARHVPDRFRSGQTRQGAPLSPDRLECVSLSKPIRTGRTKPER